MMLKLYERAVLTADMPDEGLRAGDVGVVVEHYPASGVVPEGYEVEFFSATGDTLAVASIPASKLREASPRDVLAVRELSRA